MSEALEGAAAAHSVDWFLGGLVTLVQPRRGHRAGLDAALLQALVPATAAGHAVDLGTGVGTVAFAVAARAPTLTVVGVERDPELISCGQVALHLPANAAFSARVQLRQSDLTQSRPAREHSGLVDGSADWVLMNPPYDRPGQVRASHDALRRSAHLEDPGGLAAWCRTAAGVTKPGGFLGMIYRTAALPDILEALGGRFGEIRILPVHPAAGAPASRILVQARRGSRAGMQILPGIQLHEDNGGWTPFIDAVLRGRAELRL